MGFTSHDLFFGSPDYSGQAAAAEKKRQALINQGTANINNAFSGFDQNFYNQRALAYQNFAMPQLADQYRQTRNQEMFGLANRGLLGGSAAGTTFSNLNRQMAQNQQAIVDTGLSQAQQLQRQVESGKSTLLDQLYQSADPAGARASAVDLAASYSAPGTFAQLGNMFGNVAQQYYLSQLINSTRPTGGGYPGSSDASVNSSALPKH